MRIYIGNRGIIIISCGNFEKIRSTIWTTPINTTRLVQNHLSIFTFNQILQTEHCLVKKTKNQRDLFYDHILDS